MSPGARCEHIVRLIDEVLGDSEAPGGSGAPTSARRAATNRAESESARPPSALRSRLQCDVLGPFWRSDESH